MHPRALLLASLLALSLLLPVGGHAASIVAWDVAQLTHHSDLVVEATVVSIAAEPLPDGTVQTRNVLQVESYLKGDGPQRLDVLQLGGRIGDKVVVVWGDIQLRPGQHVVLFARGAAPEVHATLLSWSVFEIVGDGAAAPVVRATEGLEFYKQDERGELSPATEEDLRGPQTLGQLRSQVAAAAGADR